MNTPKWEFINCNDVEVNNLVTHFNINKTLAVLLYNRGYTTPEKVKSFISPDIIMDLKNPFGFNDMEKTVLRIKEAIAKNEKILIYGDRDVDGVSSTVILYKALKHLKANVDYSIPTKDSGYGLSVDLIKSFHKNGINLLITVDNGITANKEVELANSLGMQVIITDHHNPPDTLPESFAILNPKVSSEKYEFKELAGVGVVYKLVAALFLSFHKYYLKDIVVLDVETTGLTQSDEIIELYAIKMRNNIEIDTFHSYINPGFVPPLSIQRMLGIDNEILKEAPTADVVIPKFYEFIKDAILVGHNIKEFDIKFIKKAVKRYCGIELENSMVDTLELTRKKYPGKSHKLANIARLMEIPSIQENSFHTAKYDTKITAIIFKKLLLSGFKKMRKVLETYSEIAALGTLADIVPLIDENRIIVRKGIEKLRNTDILGLKALFNLLQIESSNINSKTLSWNIIPVLNAAGRMGMADSAAKLLLTDDPDEAEDIAKHLIQLNKKRKERFNENFERVIQILPEKVDLLKDKIYIIDIEDVEHGVTGIIANRLKDIYYRPVVILIVKDDKAIGSARSVKSFVIKDAFDKCMDFIEEMGGHSYAVGFSIKKVNIPLFKEKLKEIADKELKPEDLMPVITIDTELDEDELKLEVLEKIINTLEPYGEDNEEPVFLLRNFRLKEIREVGNDGKHLFMKVSKQDRLSFNAIWWQKAEEKRDILKIDDIVDIACKIEIDKWNEKKYIKLLIEDIRPSI